MTEIVSPFEVGITQSKTQVALAGARSQEELGETGKKKQNQETVLGSVHIHQTEEKAVCFTGPASFCPGGYLDKTLQRYVHFL